MPSEQTETYPLTDPAFLEDPYPVYRRMSLRPSRSGPSPGLSSASSRTVHIDWPVARTPSQLHHARITTTRPPAYVTDAAHQWASDVGPWGRPPVAGRHCSISLALQGEER
jgi:hypothetical protein